MILNIQDKEYTLKYTINGLKLLEDITGRRIMDVLSEKELSISTIVNLIYCGLKPKHDELTLKQTGDLIDAYLDDDNNTFEGLIEVVTKEFEKCSLLKKKQVKKKQAN